MLIQAPTINTELRRIAGIASKQYRNDEMFLKGWIQKMVDDKKFIVQAAAVAQKANDHILNNK